MLGSFRKFSTSIYAKIILAIIVIPFVFWGMGGAFSGGNKNVVVTIDKEKYSTQEFVNFINTTKIRKVMAKDVENFVSSFISEKILEKEIESFGINLSDISLVSLIKNQRNFKREDKFSRLEYEKFLLENNLTAITFETLLTKQEKKKQLLDFVGGGVIPSKFMTNISFDGVNQERSIQVINLNDLFNKKINLSEDQIKTYFENKKDLYTDKYKTVNFLELKPNLLSNENEFNDLFFKKVDEIEDLIIKGNDLNYITQNYNLPSAATYKFNNIGQDLNLKINTLISKSFVDKIFNADESDPIFLLEDKNKYYIVEINKTENIQKNLNNEIVKKKVTEDLFNISKRKLISELISKINNNKFDKAKFDKLSKDSNLKIDKINLKNQNDQKILKIDIVNEIYSYPEKKVIVVHALDFSDNYLIYIEKITNVTIDKNSDEYEKYVNLSKNKLVNDVFNTYDSYIRNRYKIDINYQALDVVKNYYN
jgi:peptidyl-prolyl cis-trans isomerase D